jgi:hypothetical protein
MDYANATTDWWGLSIFSVGCKDNFSNCPDLAKGSAPCCDPSDVMESMCCASCATLNEMNNCNAKLSDDEPKTDKC